MSTPQVDTVAGGDPQKTFSGHPPLPSSAFHDLTRHPPLPYTALDTHPGNSPLLDGGSRVESAPGYSSLAGKFSLQLPAVQAAGTTLASVQQGFDVIL